MTKARHANLNTAPLSLPEELQNLANWYANRMQSLEKSRKKWRALSLGTIGLAGLLMAAESTGLTHWRSAFDKDPIYAAPKIEWDFNEDAKQAYMVLVHEINSYLSRHGLQNMGRGGMRELKIELQAMTPTVPVTADDVKTARNAFYNTIDRIKESTLENLFKTQGIRGLLGGPLESYDPLKDINPTKYKSLERSVANYNHGRKTGRI